MRSPVSLHIVTPAPNSPAARAGASRWADAAHAPADASIVVIGDERQEAGALTGMLREAGHRRVASLAGRAFTVQALHAAQPDLVLLELALTQADAFEVLRCMQADRILRHVPVIVLTTQDDLANRLHAFEVGAADFLVKPVDAGEMQLRLRNTLAAKAFRDQVAHTDHLTGLPNRESVLRQLDGALLYAECNGTIGAVLQVGLDRFREVNDALGPAVGDELLQAVAQRLLAGLRDSGIVARGAATSTAAVLSRGTGDEFTVLLPVVQRVDEAVVVAERMSARMAEPFAVGGHEVFVSCRIGIAVFPRDGDDMDTVLKHAGVAMRCARRVDRMAGGGIQFYSDELHAKSLHRLGVERELHHALERGEFRVYYQPQVDVAGGRVCGAEALVRWQHPWRGLLDPDEFIAVAEDTGLIVPLGAWVLREALRQMAEWRRSGLDLPQMAVNVSSLQVQRPGLCDDVRAALDGAGVDGSSLCLELTESAIIESGPQVTDTLKAVRRLGVRIALDDFGTGYSSLTYLRRFPIDELKIDRSFVTDCDCDDNNSAITAAIIAVAHRLGLTIVAEGVETQQQLEFIRSNGAESFQGFLFARPMPAGEFADLLGRAGPATWGAAAREPIAAAR